MPLKFCHFACEIPQIWHALSAIINRTSHYEFPGQSAIFGFQLTRRSDKENSVNASIPLDSNRCFNLNFFEKYRDIWKLLRKNWTRLWTACLKVVVLVSTHQIIRTKLKIMKIYIIREKNLAVAALLQPRFQAIQPRFRTCSSRWPILPSWAAFSATLTAPSRPAGRSTGDRYRRRGRGSGRGRDADELLEDLRLALKSLFV